MNDASRSVLVLNGPNLNLLGEREPAVYGRVTLAEIEQLCDAECRSLGLEMRFVQSNLEGELVDEVQRSRGQAGGILLNAAAYSHTSIALMDALKAVALPVVEVHLSNIHRREAFRATSFVALVADAVICGCGPAGYAYGLRHLASLLGEAP